MTKRCCAYCDREETLTREHVWPNCFLERRGRTAAHFSLRSGQVHGADYVVNDVCHTCNHERIGPLDAYFCRLDDEYLAEPRDFDTTLVFRYDFDLLVRTLLKIGYNAARGAGTSTEPFQPIRSYIIGTGERPKLLAAFVELVSPSILVDETAPGGTRKVMPEIYRSAIFQLTTRAGEQVALRVVAVNSFFFHLLLPYAHTSAKDFHEAVDDLGRLVTGVVKLEPDVGEVTVSSSPQDSLRSFRPHLEKHADAYREHFEKRKRKD